MQTYCVVSLSIEPYPFHYLQIALRKHFISCVACTCVWLLVDNDKGQERTCTRIQNENVWDDRVQMLMTFGI